MTIGFASSSGFSGWMVFVRTDNFGLNSPADGGAITGGGGCKGTKIISQSGNYFLPASLGRSPLINTQVTPVVDVVILQTKKLLLVGLIDSLSCLS